MDDTAVNMVPPKECDVDTCNDTDSSDNTRRFSLKMLSLNAILEAYGTDPSSIDELAELTQRLCMRVTPEMVEEAMVLKHGFQILRAFYLGERVRADELYNFAFTVAVSDIDEEKFSWISQQDSEPHVISREAFTFLLWLGGAMPWETRQDLLRTLFGKTLEEHENGNPVGPQDTYIRAKQLSRACKKNQTEQKIVRGLVESTALGLLDKVIEAGGTLHGSAHSAMLSMVLIASDLPSSNFLKICERLPIESSSVAMEVANEMLVSVADSRGRAKIAVCENFIRFCDSQWPGERYHLRLCVAHLEKNPTSEEEMETECGALKLLEHCAPEIDNPTMEWLAEIGGDRVRESLGRVPRLRWLRSLRRLRTRPSPY